MNKFRQSAYALSLLTLLFVAPAFALGTQSNTQSGSMGTNDDQTELSMTGSLKSVNPDAKTIVVTSSTGTDTEFSYDDSTTIIGAQSTIEGLSTSSGSQVTVYYKDDNGKKKATRIEVQSAQGAFPDQPRPDQPQPDQPQPDQPLP